MLLQDRQIKERKKNPYNFQSHLSGNPVDPSKVDTSEISKKKDPRTNRETVAPRRKSLREPKIALSGRVNEGERKLGTRRASWWTREGVEGRAKKEAVKASGGGEERKKGKKTSAWTLSPHTRVKPKRGPVPWTLHKPALSTLLSLPCLKLALFIFALTVPHSLPVLILPHRPRGTVLSHAHIKRF